MWLVGTYSLLPHCEIAWLHSPSLACWPLVPTLRTVLWPTSALGGSGHDDAFWSCLVRHADDCGCATVWYGPRAYVSLGEETHDAGAGPRVYDGCDAVGASDAAGHVRRRVVDDDDQSRLSSRLTVVREHAPCQRSGRYPSFAVWLPTSRRRDLRVPQPRRRWFGPSHTYDAAAFLCLCVLSLRRPGPPTHALTR